MIMPRSATTGIYTRVSNSFSQPVFGTLIDPTDADAYFDDLDVGLNPPELDGPVRIIDKLQVGTTGTAAGTIDFLNATSGSITLSPPTGALGTPTLTLPAATDTLVGKNTTDVLNNKSMNSPVINGGLISALTGFSLRDTSAAFNLTFTATSSPILTANRALTFNMNDADRTFNLAGGITIAAGGFATAGGNSTTLTTTGSTNVTLPLSGVLMTLGNNETVTGVKTFGAAGNVGKLVVAGNTSGSTILNATATASGTLTLPAATDTLVGKATTDTFTNKTFNSTGTGNVLQVSGVTVSAGQYPGEPTTGNATSGNVGEYIESILTLGSATALTTATAKTVVSISLPAGDWEVDASAYYVPNTTTSITLILASLSLTTNVIDQTPGRFNESQFPAIVPGVTSTAYTYNIPNYRFSFSGTTSVFLVVQASFTVSTLSAYGIIRARRAR
jgi:hypothetical protein